MSGQWGWSGPDRNEPVGSRLGLYPRVGTAPSVARMAELERIARLYGYLPPIDQSLIEGLGGGVTLPVVLPPDRVAPAARPIDMSRFEMPSPYASVNTPPLERANPAPQNPGEVNFWQRLLAMVPTRRPATPEEAERLRLRRTEAPQPQGRPGGGQPELAEPGPFIPVDSPLTLPEVTLPAPVDEPAQAEPPQEARGGGYGRTNYGTLNARDPDFAAVREQYERGRPRDRVRDPEERALRLIASALGGMRGQEGVGVATGAIAGLGQGYARESDRDEALWQRHDEATRQFELGLAGLLGQQEQAQFNNALQRAMFDRQSAIAGDADARAREDLEIRRTNANDARTLTRLRIAALARQMGMESDPAQIMARGVQAFVEAPAAQLFVNGRPITFDIGEAPSDRNLTFAQIRDRLLRSRGQASNFATNPLFANNPAMINSVIEAELGRIVTDRIMRMTPEERNQVLMQLGRLSESRPRSGSTRVAGE